MGRRLPTALPPPRVTHGFGMCPCPVLGGLNPPLKGLKRTADTAGRRLALLGERIEQGGQNLGNTDGIKGGEPGRAPRNDGCCNNCAIR